MDNSQACKELRKSNNIFKLVLRAEFFLITIIYLIGNLFFFFMPDSFFGAFKIVLLFLWIAYPLLPCVLREQRFVNRNLTFLKENFLESVVENEKIFFRLTDGELSIDLESLSKQKNRLLVSTTYIFVYFKELQLYLPAKKEVIMKESQWRELIENLQAKKSKNANKRKKTFKIRKKEENLTYNFRYVAEVAASNVVVLITDFWCSCFCLTIYWTALFAFFLPFLYPGGRIVFMLLLLLCTGGNAWFRWLSNRGRRALLLGTSIYGEPFPAFQIQDNFLVYQLEGKSGKFDLSKINLVEERIANVFSLKVGKIYFYGINFPEDLPWGDPRWKNSHKKGHLFRNRKLILINCLLLIVYCVVFQLVLNLF